MESKNRSIPIVSANTMKFGLAILVIIYLIGLITLVDRYDNLQKSSASRKELALTYSTLQTSAGALEKSAQIAAVVGIVFVESPIIVPIATVTVIGVNVFSKVRYNYFKNKYVDRKHPITHKWVEAMVGGVFGAIFWVVLATFMRRKYQPSKRDSITRSVVDERDDSDLYLKATQEVERHTVDPALWAKAMALNAGDEKKAKYEYINLRVKYASGTQERSPIETTEAVDPIEEKEVLHEDITTQESKSDLWDVGTTKQNIRPKGEKVLAYSFITTLILIFLILSLVGS